MALTDAEREALRWAGLIPTALRELAPLIEGDDENNRDGEMLRIAAGVLETTPIQQIAETFAALRTDEAYIAEGDAIIGALDASTPVRVQ